jgi:hypothetical protein
MSSGLIFSRAISPEKNREIFAISPSHNTLSARYLHNGQFPNRRLTGFNGTKSQPLALTIQ